MIRNMEPLRVPVGGNPFGEVIKNFGRAHSAKKASIDADRIIAVSGHVKEFLTNKWGLRPEKIGVVYHGVDIPTAPYHSSAFLNLECIVDRRFIFTAGSIRPARGLEDLLSAFGLVLDAVPGIKLVIAGSIDPGMGAYKSRLEKILKRSGVVSSVVWTGALTDMQMSWCYHNCSVFVMTSRAEACPNVVLEAMSHGCISVSTDTDPMPEFYADTALYYSAADHVMLAKAIQSALALDKSQRMERSANSKSRAALFSWDVCVNRTIQELVEAVKIFHGSYKE
jgi:glycosyltransferase involved in cell wall biosynthesis